MHGLYPGVHLCPALAGMEVAMSPEPTTATVAAVTAILRTIPLFMSLSFRMWPMEA